MQRTKINRLLGANKPQDDVFIQGWVRTRRNSSQISFIEINDGSCLKNMQVIADANVPNYADIRNISTGSAVAVRGALVASQGSGQKWEMSASCMDIISLAPDDYPLQKKRHSDEFLRSIAHLRPRTNKYGAAFRIRSELSFAIHSFFRDKGFRYIHSPIITGSDCEGAGEIFQITTLNLDNVPKKENRVDFSEDFFAHEANLTVSGQLSAEMFAQALGDVYTFGPTFRAENSNTSRHVAEFWMVEPEMAFCDIHGNMDLAEEMLKYLTRHIMESCQPDLELFAKYVDKRLPDTLDKVISNTFDRITYEDALNILEQSGRKFEYNFNFGSDLQAEHERFITEEYFKRPVIIRDYPKQIKPFYMRLNDDDRTVAAMDVLVPGIGEIIGGSQREERLDRLLSSMQAAGMSEQNYWWYVDSRKYGSVPHSGFGLGFERLMMLITGIKNIRDVIPFPRTPKSIDF